MLYFQWIIVYIIYIIYICRVIQCRVTLILKIMTTFEELHDEFKRLGYKDLVKSTEEIGVTLFEKEETENAWTLTLRYNDILSQNCWTIEFNGYFWVYKTFLAFEKKLLYFINTYNFVLN